MATWDLYPGTENSLSASVLDRCRDAGSALAEDVVRLVVAEFLASARLPSDAYFEVEVSAGSLLLRVVDLGDRGTASAPPTHAY